MQAKLFRDLAVKLAGVDEELAHLVRQFDAVSSPSRPRGRVATDELEPRARLLALMLQAFNLDELMEICFAVGVFWDQLSGDTLTRRALAMIENLERAGRLYMLIDQCQQRRPHLDWPTL